MKFFILHFLMLDMLDTGAFFEKLVAFYLYLSALHAPVDT